MSSPPPPGPRKRNSKRSKSTKQKNESIQQQKQQQIPSSQQVILMTSMKMSSTVIDSREGGIASESTNEKQAVSSKRTAKKPPKSHFVDPLPNRSTGEFASNSVSPSPILRTFSQMASSGMGNSTLIEDGLISRRSMNCNNEQPSTHTSLNNIPDTIQRSSSSRNSYHNHNNNSNNKKEFNKQNIITTQQISLDEQQKKAAAEIIDIGAQISSQQMSLMPDKDLFSFAHVLNQFQLVKTPLQLPITATSQTPSSSSQSSSTSTPAGNAIQSSNGNGLINLTSATQNLMNPVILAQLQLYPPGIAASQYDSNLPNSLLLRKTMRSQSQQSQSSQQQQQKFSEMRMDKLERERDRQLVLLSSLQSLVDGFLNAIAPANRSSDFVDYANKYLDEMQLQQDEQKQRECSSQEQENTQQPRSRIDSKSEQIISNARTWFESLRVKSEKLEKSRLLASTASIRIQRDIESLSDQLKVVRSEIAAVTSSMPTTNFNNSNGQQQSQQQPIQPTMNLQALKEFYESEMKQLKLKITSDQTKSRLCASRCVEVDEACERLTEKLEKQSKTIESLEANLARFSDNTKIFANYEKAKQLKDTFRRLDVDVKLQLTNFDRTAEKKKKSLRFLNRTIAELTKSISDRIADITSQTNAFKEIIADPINGNTLRDKQRNSIVLAAQQNYYFAQPNTNHAFDYHLIAHLPADLFETQQLIEAQNALNDIYLIPQTERAPNYAPPIPVNTNNNNNQSEQFDEDINNNNNIKSKRSQNYSNIIGERKEGAAYSTQFEWKRSLNTSPITKWNASSNLTGQQSTSIYSPDGQQNVRLERKKSSEKGNGANGNSNAIDRGDYPYIARIDPNLSTNTVTNFIVESSSSTAQQSQSYSQQQQSRDLNALGTRKFAPRIRIRNSQIVKDSMPAATTQQNVLPNFMRLKLTESNNNPSHGNTNSNNPSSNTKQPVPLRQQELQFSTTQSLYHNNHLQPQKHLTQQQQQYMQQLQQQQQQQQYQQQQQQVQQQQQQQQQQSLNQQQLTQNHSAYSSAPTSPTSSKQQQQPVVVAATAGTGTTTFLPSIMGQSASWNQSSSSGSKHIQIPKSIQATTNSNNNNNNNIDNAVEYLRDSSQSVVLPTQLYSTQTPIASTSAAAASRYLLSSESPVPTAHTMNTATSGMSTTSTAAAAGSGLQNYNPQLQRSPSPFFVRKSRIQTSSSPAQHHHQAKHQRAATSQISPHSYLGRGQLQIKDLLLKIGLPQNQISMAASIVASAANPATISTANTLTGLNQNMVGTLSTSTHRSTSTHTTSRRVQPLLNLITDSNMFVADSFANDTNIRSSSSNSGTVAAAAGSTGTYATTVGGGGVHYADKLFGNLRDTSDLALTLTHHNQTFLSAQHQQQQQQQQQLRMTQNFKPSLLNEPPPMNRQIERIYERFTLNKSIANQNVTPVLRGETSSILSGLQLQQAQQQVQQREFFSRQDNTPQQDKNNIYFEELEQHLFHSYPKKMKLSLPSQLPTAQG